MSRLNSYRGTTNSTTRSSSRLDGFGASGNENCPNLFGDRIFRTGTAPSVLADRTSFHNNSNNINSLSGSLAKATKPALAAGAPLSARPPLPNGESSRISENSNRLAENSTRLTENSRLNGELSARPLATPRPTEAWAGDDADSGNEQCVSEYVQDIFKVLHQEETTDLPRPDYMESQADINPRMRAILIDWLVEVHMKYKLKSETLFLSVSILDRFLAKKRVSRKKLQLVGVTATLIAAKYEEIYPPEINDLVYICDKAYTKNEIVEMEIVVLTLLEFQLRVPTAVAFLDRFGKVNSCTECHRQLAQYLAELALPEIKTIRYQPSHLAASAIFLSNKLLKQPVAWSQTMVTQTGYTEATIKACAKELCMLLEGSQASSLQAVKKKFSYAKYHSVAKIPF